MLLTNDEVVQIVSLLSRWKVHAPKTNDLMGAIEFQKRYAISFWDAMILWSAGQLGCDIVYSEDLNHEQQSAIAG